MCKFVGLVLLLIVSGILTHLDQQDNRVILRNCEDLVSKFKNKFSANISDSQFQKFSVDLVKAYKPFPITENPRFLLDIKDSSGKVIKSYGNCAVPFNSTMYTLCSFTFDPTAEVKFYYMMLSEDRIKCEEDTSPKILVWDGVLNQEFMLNFGASCCVYNPESQLPDRDNRYLVITLYSSAGILLSMFIVSLSVKFYKWKKKSGN